LEETADLFCDILQTWTYLISHPLQSKTFVSKN